MSDARVELQSLLADPAQAGAYFIDARDREPLEAAARILGYTFARIDFTGCAGKDEALARIARALAFPDWFGANWDALFDSLCDLAPAPGYLLLLEHADAWRAAARADFDTALEVFNEAAAAWKARAVPFWALLPVAADTLAALEK